MRTKKTRKCTNGWYAKRIVFDSHLVWRSFQHTSLKSALYAKKLSSLIKLTIY